MPRHKTDFRTDIKTVRILANPVYERGEHTAWIPGHMFRLIDLTTEFNCRGHDTTPAERSLPDGVRFCHYLNGKPHRYGLVYRGLWATDERGKLLLDASGEPQRFKAR